ncbi:hypothetical protein BKA80DRAFT_303529 [Phyllosticta citrichinensis]
MFEKKKFLVSFALPLPLPLPLQLLGLVFSHQTVFSPSASGFPLTAAYPIHRLSLPTHASLAPTIHQQPGATQRRTPPGNWQPWGMFGLRGWVLEVTWVMGLRDAAAAAFSASASAAASDTYASTRRARQRGINRQGDLHRHQRGEAGGRRHSPTPWRVWTTFSPQKQKQTGQQRVDDGAHAARSFVRSFVGSRLLYRYLMCRCVDVVMCGGESPQMRTASQLDL